MAVGWARDDAASEQINDSISDAVARARRELPRGESLKFCEDCGEEIPAARRAALPGVRLCLECQAAAEKNRFADYSLYNRRGSKDSQLR
jgi:phage/conjugal plasmid C-4 type zinc finger TraR family protein